MRLYCLIQMAAVWKNRTRKFHSVLKVTQTFFSLSVDLTAGGAEYTGEKGIAVNAGEKAADHHTHHLLL